MTYGGNVSGALWGSLHPEDGETSHNARLIGSENERARSPQQKEEEDVAKCTARCYWIDYETKQPDHFNYSINIKTTQEIPGDSMPSPNEFSAIIQGVIEEYNGRDLVEVQSMCEGGCNWEMLLEEGSPWTGWKRVPFKRSLIKETDKGQFEFEVRGELEVRKRIINGVCIEKEL
jgi:hypothetical protein